MSSPTASLSRRPILRKNTETGSPKGLPVSSTAGDFLFTCWMGYGCHSNYIHVTADGISDSNAVKGGIDGHTDSAHTEQTTSTISGTTATTAKVTTAASGTAE